jgi:hypothetical protein
MENNNELLESLRINVDEIFDTNIDRDNDEEIEEIRKKLLPMGITVKDNGNIKLDYIKTTMLNNKIQKKCNDENFSLNNEELTFLYLIIMQVKKLEDKISNNKVIYKGDKNFENMRRLIKYEDDLIKEIKKVDNSTSVSYKRFLEYKQEKEKEGIINI